MVLHRSAISERERMIVRAFAMGLRAEEIAEETGLHLRQIYYSASRVMASLGCISIPNLVVVCTFLGVIDVEDFMPNEKDLAHG
jgi:DNA-binding NarL/FixJ family response regulator